MKTARFTELVSKAGAPETYLLWVRPKDDRVFQRAVKENRILTIHQENVGAKKDYGMVGFHEELNAQFLIFPKSLKAFADRRVIGINYDLLAKDSRAIEPSTKDARAPESRVKEKVARKTEEKMPVSKPRRDADAGGEAGKVVAFEKPPPEPPAAGQEAPPSKKAPSAKPPTAEKPAKREARSSLDPRVLTVVRRAMKDLDAGKPVAAYKRLESLVEEAEKGR